jgi:hypothetical protein
VAKWILSSKIIHSTNFVQFVRFVIQIIKLYYSMEIRIFKSLHYYGGHFYDQILEVFMFPYYVELLIGLMYVIRSILSLLTDILVFTYFHENFAKLRYNVLLSNILKCEDLAKHYSSMCRNKAL